MKTIKKIVLALVATALIASLLILDGKMGEETCGEQKYNQTTGECIAK